MVSKISDKKKDILKLALSKNIHQIPIVDENKKLVGPNGRGANKPRKN